MSTTAETQKDAREVTYEELKQHVTKDNLYILLHNKVYDVSKFIDEHPGGEEVMMAEAGKDATEAFEDVGHSDEARALLSDMCVGDFEKDGSLKTKDTPIRISSGSAPEQKTSGVVTYLIPLSLLGVYFAWRFYFS